MSVILKEGHSLKRKDLVPLIERVKQLPTGTELARLTLTTPIKDLTFDGLREEFYNLTEKSMDEILARAGLPVDIKNRRALLHHAIVLANEVGDPSIQDEDQTLLKSAAVSRPTKRPSDKAHGTSSKFQKCDENDSHISGHHWFESHRKVSKWLIDQNRCVLVDNGCFSGIRDGLLHAEILTKHEVEEIEEDNIRYKQMRRFVDKLSQKSDEVIEKCFEVIREADRILYEQLQWPCPPSPDQVHPNEVDGGMPGTSSKFQKCDENDSHISGHHWFESHRKVSKWLIDQNRCVLVDNGCFSGIRDGLLHAEILTKHEVEEIEEDNIRYKQMRRFVDKLSQKSDEVIEKCFEVIREADRILYEQLQWPCPPSPDQVHPNEVDGGMPGTSSKFQKCDENDSHISGHHWFESHRKVSKWLIDQNRCVLVDNGCFSGIRDGLLHAEILTKHEVEEIEEDNIRYKQMRRFVDKLSQKSDEVIEKCFEVIREADRILYEQLQWPCPPSPDQVHPNEVDGGMPDDLGKIQQELKSWYTTQLSHFHPIPWCGWLEMDFDHVYTNLKMVEGLKHQLSSRVGPKPGSHIDDTEDLLELLFLRDGRTVTFIQGSAGSGKSTLCRRLAYLWATNNSCIHGRHFDLVLLVEARSIVGDNLKQSIVKQLFPEDYDMTEEAVSKCITTCGENALLIIDGVDELTQEGKMEAQKLLEGRFFRHTNIILTGRPESVQGFIKYVSVHLKICGFTRKNVKSYICKYFPQRNKELEHAVFTSLHFLTEGRFYYSFSDEESDDEVFGVISSEGDYDFREGGNELRDLCVNPFTICLMCLLVEEKGGDIPSSTIDILEEVITLTLDRYVCKSDINQGVTTKELLKRASEVAWMGFSGRDLHFEEEFIKELYTGGVGEHLLRSGLMNRDFTMSRFHTSGYCYFPHRSIQDYLCAKYLVNIQQTHLDEILMDLPLTECGWWEDMVKKLFYQLKGQRERLCRSVLCILDKCPVYRKLKPGFQKYVGRLTNEVKMEDDEVRTYAMMAGTFSKEPYGHIVLSTLSASDEMLRFSFDYVVERQRGMYQNILALPVMDFPFFGICQDDCFQDNYAYYHFFQRNNVKNSIKYRYTVEHKNSHMYGIKTWDYWASCRQWLHLDYYEVISVQFKESKLPSVLSVLVLPGGIDLLCVKRQIDVLNSFKTKLTLFLIAPQMQCEDLSRMRLISLIRSEVSPYIQVCCEYPNVPFRFESMCFHGHSEDSLHKNPYFDVAIWYSNPVAVHHMYYNKYCPY